MMAARMLLAKLCKSLSNEIALAVLIALTILLPAETHAGESLQLWRAEVSQTRILATNDIPAALRKARELQAGMPAGATPVDQAHILNVLARAELYFGDIALGGEHAGQALKIAEQHGDKIGQAEANLNLVISLVNQGRIEAMNAAILRSMNVLQGVDRFDLLAEAMLRTSMMYRRMDQVNDSVAVAVQLMTLARRSNSALARTYAYQAMASANDLGGRPEEGLEYFTLMRAEARRANSAILEAEAIVGIAGALNKMGEPDKAERLARESIEVNRRIGANISTNRGMLLLSGFVHERGRTREAIAILDQVVQGYEKHRVPIGLWWVLDTRSKYYLALGELKNARADSERSYLVAREIGFPLYLSESSSRLAAIAAAAGNYKEAYRFSSEAADMKAKAATDKAGERMAQLTSRYEQESHRKEVDELTRHNEKQAAELAQRALHQRWLWTLLGGSLLMLVGTGFFLLRLRRSHHRLAAANAALRISREEIRALNVDLEQRIQSRTAELRQQTRYLQTMIDMLPMLAWFKDTESRFLVVNHAVATAAGHEAEDFIGKSDHDFWPAGLAEAYRRDDREVMTTRESKTIEEQVVENGEPKWMETYKAPVLDEDGTLLGTVGVARDISAQKMTEAAREEALFEAKRLARMRSQFLAQMSHELRTPLNGILGYAQIMKRKPDLDEKQRDGLSVIQESGEHLLTLINDILEFAKIDAGKMELSPGDMALDKFLRTIVGIIGIKADQKRLKFVSEIAPDLPKWIRADEKRLRQVLLNLLANAVKFTDHGLVRLSVTMPEVGRLQFEVSDTGMGIEPADIERIFRPFEQVGNARLKVKGTGLGLPISRELVRLMGGDIAVESEPGHGSVFSFGLPVEVTEVKKRAAITLEGAAKGYSGERRRVLIVDDVAINRAVLIDMLQPLGFDLLEAADGRSAVEMVRLHAPDLVLMDLAMPEMNGIEATRAIRQLPGLEEVPIIAVSASASGKDEDASLAAGMNAFLPKPVEFDLLLNTIAQALHIEWVYEPAEMASAEGAEIAIIPPPAPEMHTLHSLAMQGNMRDIMQMAERLHTMGERYRPFADKLTALAKGYQSKAILGFVESYLDREVEE